MNVPNLVRYQLPVFLWMLAIFTLSSIPSIPEIKLPISPDKLAHAGIYFVLCMFWKRALTHQEFVGWLRVRALPVAVGLTVAHGVLDELYQMSVPGRYPDPYDALADGLGALLFAGWYLWRRRDGEEKRV